MEALDAGCPSAVAARPARGRVAATIDGRAAHRLTVTSKHPIDSGTGCWSTAEDGCFGLPPERLNAARADLVAAFGRMLGTVRFE